MSVCLTPPSACLFRSLNCSAFAHVPQHLGGCALSRWDTGCATNLCLSTNLCLCPYGFLAKLVCLYSVFVCVVCARVRPCVRVVCVFVYVCVFCNILQSASTPYGVSTSLSPLSPPAFSPWPIGPLLLALLLSATRRPLAVCVCMCVCVCLRYGRERNGLGHEGQMPWS